MTCLAQQFRDDNHAYFFDDAHFLVEADASSKAKEISYNVFRFEDGSLLQIDNHTMTVTVYAPDTPAAQQAAAAFA